MTRSLRGDEWRWKLCLSSETHVGVNGNVRHSLCVSLGRMTTLLPNNTHCWWREISEFKKNKCGKSFFFFIYLFIYLFSAGGLVTPVDGSVAAERSAHQVTRWHRLTSQGAQSPPWAAQRGWHMHCMKLDAGAVLWVKVALQPLPPPPPPEWTWISKSLQGVSYSLDIVFHTDEQKHFYLDLKYEIYRAEL